MSEISVSLSLFVEHGQQQAAADFYAAAFGAQKVQDHFRDGLLMAVDLLIGSMPISVAGANPKRQANPALGGPFHPRSAGAVSAVLRVTVRDLDTVVAQALAAGATVRDAIEQDDTGSRSAALFDPFGHIWSLTQLKADAARLAA
ncbi:VOC family protein [Pseudaminobacter soli (ex Li et al. 2025)]|uniref:VOC family protein n=1 Tax=Pseudaminobacter soli (ex Li et al. 2025) TaxID=1295366 RepID=UPI001FE159D5|nr:VOC family protein [Mesorhizobium soli]